MKGIFDTNIFWLIKAIKGGLKPTWRPPKSQYWKCISRF